MYIQVLYPGRIGIWGCWFPRREDRRTRRKTLGARQEPATNSTHTEHRARIKPKPHWWVTSALATAPPQLPNNSLVHFCLHLGWGHCWYIVLYDGTVYPENWLYKYKLLAEKQSVRFTFIPFHLFEVAAVYILC